MLSLIDIDGVTENIYSICNNATHEQHSNRTVKGDSIRPRMILPTSSSGLKAAATVLDLFLRTLD